MLHASFFFFQAEDGIRYRDVTGVQTCALPISNRSSIPPANSPSSTRSAEWRSDWWSCGPCISTSHSPSAARTFKRSEERRVGKEWRVRRRAEQEKIKYDTSTA